MPKFGLAVWQSLIHQPPSAPPQCWWRRLQEDQREPGVFTHFHFDQNEGCKATAIHCFHNWREMSYWQLSIAQNLNGRKVGRTKRRISKGSLSFCPVEKTRQRLAFSVHPLKNHFHTRGTGSGIFYSFNLLTFGSYCSYILFDYLSSLSLLLQWWQQRWWGFACMNVCDPCACVALRG